MPLRKYPISLTGGTTALDNIFALMWLLVCVIIVAALAYLFTKHVAGRGAGMLGMSGGNERFKVLARLSLGRDQGVALVQAGERYLLLGVTPSGISLVAELTREEAQALYAPPPDQPAPPSFSEALRTVLKQKKPR